MDSGLLPMRSVPLKVISKAASLTPGYVGVLFKGTGEWVNGVVFMVVLPESEAAYYEPEMIAEVEIRLDRPAVKLP